MTDESTREIKQAQPAPRSESLTDEDRRLLAALLDELLGMATDGRPLPQSRGAGKSTHGSDAALSTPLASHGR
jgi:hypothetical protein